MRSDGWMSAWRCCEKPNLHTLRRFARRGARACGRPFCARPSGSSCSGRGGGVQAAGPQASSSWRRRASLGATPVAQCARTRCAQHGQEHSARRLPDPSSRSRPRRAVDPAPCVRRSRRPGGLRPAAHVPRRRLRLMRLPNLTKLHVHPCHYGAVTVPWSIPPSGVARESSGPGGLYLWPGVRVIGTLSWTKEP